MLLKVLFFLILVNFSFASNGSFNMNNFIKQLQEKSNNSVKKYYSTDTENFLKQKEEDVNYNTSLNLYKKYFSNDSFTIENYPKVLNKKIAFQRKTILFYLFTTNMPKEAYLNVFKQAELIKNKLPVIGVLRGMDLKTKAKLDDAFRGTKIKFEGRVNPFFFRDLGIKKAPVFLIANCQVKPYLRYKSCKFLYRFDGDVSLAYALTQIGEYNEDIKKISMVFYK